jgi:tetratricopeptide (TPR) repeat protein
LGNVQKAIEYYEQALVISHKIGNRKAEENILICLGYGYHALGDYCKSLEYCNQALTVIREIGDRRNESYALDKTGSVYLDLNKMVFAVNYFKDAMEISDKISFPIIQNSSRYGLAESYLFQDDVVNARATIEAALQYDVPEYNHNASALHGIIALRQGERETAQEAFTKSIAQADEILAKTPDYYSALDAKGLALCGLLVIGNWRLDGERDKLHAEAMETFRKARGIAPHAGVVKSVLRLFDELVKCDEEGALKDVRKAVEGK